MLFLSSQNSIKVNILIRQAQMRSHQKKIMVLFHLILWNVPVSNCFISNLTTILVVYFEFLNSSPEAKNIVNEKVESGFLCFHCSQPRR